MNLSILKNHASRDGLRILAERIRDGFHLTNPNSFVREKGWERWTEGGAPKRPMPWLPYCLTTFLDQRLPKEASVLELGAGWGTVWWDRRQSGSVHFAEGDLGWVDRLIPHLNHATLGPRHLVDYDLVIVDSDPSQRRFELECATSLVKRTGVIILDDTHRERERTLGEEMMKGWRSIYWEGLGPWSHQTHGSTLFYRDGNILGI